MSYLQIEIGGKLRGLKFSQGTNILLQDKLLEWDKSERKAFGMQYIIWAGLKTNCAIKGERFTKDVDGKEQPATIEDVFEWVELLTDDVKMDIVNLYSEVNSVVPKSENDTDETDEKKNIITQPVVIDSDAAS